MDGKRLVWGSTENRSWDVMVADFADAPINAANPIFRDWRRLGDTSFYALPLQESSQ